MIEIIKIPTVVDVDGGYKKADQYINANCIVCFNECPEDLQKESNGLAKTQISVVVGGVHNYVYATITPEELLKIFKKER